MPTGVLLYPVSNRLRQAIWSVGHQSVRIMRLDDATKTRRAVRTYRQAVQQLLDVALAERQNRQARNDSPSNLPQEP